MPRPQPFPVHVPEEVIDDLLERLRRTRWPPTLHGGGWNLGTDPAYRCGLAVDLLAAEIRSAAESFPAAGEGAP